MEELILDARMDEHGQLNDEDLKELQNQGENMVRGKTNKNSESTYKRYQNLWQDYFRQKNIKDNMDYVCLTAFFQSIERKCAGGTLWVIFGCINSYMIDKFGAKLKNFVHLTKYIKTVTLHYVAEKSKIFSAEQIHEVIAHCMYTESNDNPS